MEKWYSDLLYKEESAKTNDGLASLLNMFNCEKDFIRHFIENTIFFEKEHIVKQNLEYYNKNLESNTPLVVRYSTKSNEHFYFKAENARGFSRKKFKNRKEAHDFSRSNNLFYKSDCGKEILVHIDKDGNYEVRNQISKYTGIKVSQGTTVSTHTNYTISHIWAKTEHPLFFTALWNIALVPSYLAFILDKPDENSEIIRKLKLLMQILCYDFYQPKIIDYLEIEKIKASINYDEIYHLSKYNINFK